MTVLMGLWCSTGTGFCFLQHLPFRGPGSVVGIATGYRLDGPGIESRWGRDFSHLSRPALGPIPASCTMGTRSFPGVKSRRSVTLTPHPLLVPWSWKSRAIPLLPLWAVRPVQSLSACTGVTFTFTLPTFPPIFKFNFEFVHVVVSRNLRDLKLHK